MSATFHMINAYIALAAAMVNLAFAVIVIARTSRTTVYIAFFYSLICIALWTFGDFMVYAMGERLWIPVSEGVHKTPWFYLSLIGAAMAPAFVFHFLNALVMADRKNRLLILMVYFFATILAYSSSIALFNDKVKSFVDSTLWNMAHLALLMPFLLWGVILVLLRIVHTESENEKSLLKYVVLAVALAVFAGITDLVQLLGIDVPPLGHMGTIAFPLILSGGILKHKDAIDVLALTRRKVDTLTEMAGGIAHEIRNPLSTIGGALTNMGSELASLKNRPMLDQYGLIKDEIGRVNAILSSFQDLTGKLSLEKEEISLLKLVTRTITLAEAAGFSIKTEVRQTGEDAVVMADPTLVRQLFLNIMRNAEDACGPGGFLDISVENVTGWGMVTFSDDGPGISDEIVDTIFEPFFTTKRGGMGLGLAICNRIVKAHDGKIKAENAEGGGAMITVSLPANH